MKWIGMPGSTLSVFGMPDDYQAALGGESRFALMVTGQGAFRARLARIALPQMYLLSGEESVSRIAFVSVPPHLVRISLPSRNGHDMFRDGLPCRSDEIVTHGGGERLHERTDGPCRWRSVWALRDELMRYGHAVIGDGFMMSSQACRWRPTAATLRGLTRIHDDAIRANLIQPGLAAAPEAARGLEKQLLHAVIETLAEATVVPGTEAARRHTEIMCRFEDLIRADPRSSRSGSWLCSALGVEGRTLRLCCEAYLGLTPLRYVQLSRLRHARQALLVADPEQTTVAAIARQHGFNQLGRFASTYRAQFGELPSITLRQSASA